MKTYKNRLSGESLLAEPLETSAYKGYISRKEKGGYNFYEKEEFEEFFMQDCDVYCPYCNEGNYLVDHDRIEINWKDGNLYFDCTECKGAMGYNLKVNPDMLLRLIKEKL